MPVSFRTTPAVTSISPQPATNSITVIFLLGTAAPVVAMGRRALGAKVNVTVTPAGTTITTSPQPVSSPTVTRELIAHRAACAVHRPAGRITMTRLDAQARGRPEGPSRFGMCVWRWLEWAGDAMLHASKEPSAGS
ncbi:hypothetical protein N8071_00745 [bacterium]|nr:hypothetical protein [bacterium]